METTKGKKRAATLASLRKRATDLAIAGAAQMQVEELTDAIQNALEAQALGDSETIPAVTGAVEPPERERRTAGTQAVVERLGEPEKLGSKKKPIARIRGASEVEIFSGAPEGEVKNIDGVIKAAESEMGRDISDDEKRIAVLQDLQSRKERRGGDHRDAVGRVSGVNVRDRVTVRESDG